MASTVRTLLSSGVIIAINTGLELSGSRYAPVLVQEATERQPGQIKNLMQKLCIIPHSQLSLPSILRALRLLNTITYPKFQFRSYSNISERTCTPFFDSCVGTRSAFSSVLLPSFIGQINRVNHFVFTNLHLPLRPSVKKRFSSSMGDSRCKDGTFAIFLQELYQEQKRK